MSPWVLIPAKALHLGKRRLSSALSDAARHALNRHLLLKTVETARRFAGVERTAVISESEAVLRLASRCGVKTIRQTRAPGLNHAAAEGVAELSRAGATRMLLLPVDLPQVRVEDLEEIVAADPRGGSVTICPDRHRRGTNAMVVPAFPAVRFCFGADSFARHVCEVLRVALTPVVHVNARVGNDVDTVDDLAAWLDGLPDGEMLRTEFGRRIGRLAGALPRP